MKLQIGDQIIDVERQLAELDRVDYEESLYKFLRAGWKNIDPAPWKDGWAIEAIAEHLQAVVDGDIKRLIINLPPRMGKSSVCSVALPAWAWAQPEKRWGPTSGPAVQFLHASYAAQLSVRDSVKCRRLIQSPWYQQHWGKRFHLASDQNVKGRFLNDKGGERLITSVGSAATGEGGSCFVAGTLVDTPSGRVPIEQIKPDMVVYAFDHQRGKVVKSRVVATAERASRDLYKLHTTAGHSFTCTGDHPVFAEGRGYIRAGDMGPRDRVLVSGGGEAPNGHDAAPDMRPLRHADRQASVRDTQGAKTGESGRLLLQEVLLGASRYEEQPPMRDMRHFGREAFSQPILLRPMQDRGAVAPPENVAMPPVRNDVRTEGRWSQKVLQLGVCGRGSFGAHERPEEFQFHEVGEILEPISGYAQDHSGAGRVSVRGLRGAGSNREAWEHDEVSASCTPHRREHEEQRTGESDHALRELSQETPSWEFAAISDVEFVGGREVSVYDIQIEGRSNFFADGVLVHNCIIIDDPNAADEAFSEATVEATIEWWDGTMSTRLNDAKTGAYIVIQQRLAEDDLTGHILSKDKGEWTHLVLPMHYDPDRSFVTRIGWKDPRTVAGELLWPERFGVPEVEALERSLVTRAAGQLEQAPVTPGGGIIKRAWWQLWEADSFPPMDYILASVDTAYTEKTINDPSAMTVWGVFTQDPVAIASRMIGADGRPEYLPRTYTEQAPKVMLMAAWAEHLEFHDLVEKIAKTAKKCRVDKILIEAKASGISVAQELRRVYSAENFAVQLNDPKSTDKVSRLYSVQHIFNDGTVYAPDRKWTDEVISEVEVFPKGKHDDRVDTVSQAMRHMRDLGLLVRAPERLAEIDEMRQYAGKPPEALYPS